jgi:hypothetical protein
MPRPIWTWEGRGYDDFARRSATLGGCRISYYHLLGALVYTLADGRVRCVYLDELAEYAELGELGILAKEVSRLEEAVSRGERWQPHRETAEMDASTEAVVSRGGERR